MAEGLMIMGGLALVSGVTSGYGIYTQTVQLCNQWSSIGQNIDALNDSMQQVLQSYQQLDQELLNEITTLQMAIADNTSKLLNLQNSYKTTHTVLQITLMIDFVVCLILLVLKHYGVLTWYETLYIIFAGVVINMLLVFLYARTLAPGCINELIPPVPIFTITPQVGCPCTTSDQCPFGCQQGCWNGSLNWTGSTDQTITGFRLQIQNLTGTIIQDVNLPAFAGSYPLSSINASYAPLQANLAIIDLQGCQSQYSSIWWINANDYISSSTISLISPEGGQAVTSFPQGSTSQGIGMQPYVANSSSQSFYLRIDQSGDIPNFYVLQTPDSNKLIANAVGGQDMYIVSLADTDGVCIPAGCSVCQGNYSYTQAFGLYPVQSDVGMVVLYYNNAGTFYAFNAQTSQFESTGVSSSVPFTDSNVQPQWKLTYLVN